jgi:hypothetical protein
MVAAMHYQEIGPGDSDTIESPSDSLLRVV